jgi:hypothetical protein
MIILGFALVGAIFGGLLARKRGGKKLDIAQYAGVYAIVFGIIGLFLTVYLSRG